ncbi:MAG: hypothetical protein EOM20_04155 [Spartobacteria bacterium]|nr:hypothetical protein [Spartobacteria bacterium]
MKRKIRVNRIGNKSGRGCRFVDRSILVAILNILALVVCTTSVHAIGGPDRDTDLLAALKDMRCAVIQEHDFVHAKAPALPSLEIHTQDADTYRVTTKLNTIFYAETKPQALLRFVAKHPTWEQYTLELTPDAIYLKATWALPIVLSKGEYATQFDEWKSDMAQLNKQLSEAVEADTIPTITFPPDMNDWGDIGARIGEITEAQADELGIDPIGIYIERTLPGWPAEAVGLKKGDVITERNGLPITNADEFQNWIDTQIGSNITLTIHSTSGRRTVTMPVASVKEKAAQQNGDAFLMLTIYYAYGLGVPEDPKQAFAWAKKGAEVGDTVCMSLLAKYYYEGYGVPEDPKQAFAWAKKGADLGRIDCMALLAILYDKGSGVSKVPKQAFAWAKKGAEVGRVDCMAMLARFYTEGSGVPKDPKQAYAWAKNGAELGDADCMSWLAKFYYEGSGVPKDPKQAVTWAKKGADLGDTDCMWWLAGFYYEGFGVPRDPEQAFTWAKKGAELGHADCMALLSRFYYEGTGTKLNNSKAKEWLKRAADLGNIQAKKILDTWR